MKVAHLTTVDMSLRFLLFPQLRAVVDAGGEVLGISASGPWVPDLENARIRHISLPASTRGMNLSLDVRAAVQLWRILRRERPDILHTHNPKPGVYGRILGRLAGVPVVVNTVHGLYAMPDDPLSKRIVIYGLEAIASRFSHAELVQSREDFELMTRLRIAPRHRTRLLGNGVDLTRFDPDRFDQGHRDRTRDKLGVRPDQVLVGMVGRLVEEKGLLELFEASRSLDAHYRIVCIGPRDPEKPDALDERIIREAEARGISFLGMRTDLDELYPAMDLLVLPSHREGFPRAAMEAVAMGLPVIASDIRGCREVVGNGLNGLLVPVRDPQALATAIVELGENPARRKAMAVAARSRAVEHFDERKVVAIVMETYRELSRRMGLGLFDDVEIAAVTLRRAELSDADAVAGLHIAAISEGFLPRLGRGFMRILYRALITSPEAVVTVADDGRGPVGFVAGVVDTGRFYRRFLIRYGLPALLAALPKLIRPAVAQKGWETLRYGATDSETSAELLAMALAPAARGRGLGSSLGSRFLDEMSARGVRRVKVVVGSTNFRAIAAYRSIGFGNGSPIQVHAGEAALELTWPA
jgi:glycosyltransferase involved in cell wall biosynthesis/ribosomal protein S18 acetylase RimI-like enzyme